MTTKPRFRNPGLLHSLQAVEVEEVTKRMRKECCQCGESPTARRLTVKAGSGRSQQQHVLCHRCGIVFLGIRRVEVERAQQRLAGNDLCVRQERFLPTTKRA